ncbi:hypothetical protein HYT84_04565 [Candidatus Micrarchaeota archaeon]|nr:hypothetical protein [Candidatus Micrarchaeota archaeon]
MVKLEIVKETRQIGRARLYKLNSHNPVVQQLISLDNKLIKELADDLVTEKIENRSRK